MAATLNRRLLWRFLLLLLFLSIVFVIQITFKLVWEGDNRTTLVYLIQHADGRRISHRMHGMRRMLPWQKAIVSGYLGNSSGPPFVYPAPTILSKQPKMRFVVLVLSHVKNVRRRSAIRETLSKENITSVYTKTVFVTGKLVDDTIEIQNDVVSGAFDDDDLYSDTRKTLLGLHWALTHCYNVSFVAVVKDTMYVNYQLLGTRLFDRMRRRTAEKMWIGNIQKHMSRAEISGDELPTFCTIENGYVLSGNAAKYLIQWSFSNRISPLVDVFIGYAARDGSWSIIADEKIIPRSDESVNICAFKNQTITADFYKEDMWNVTQNHRRIFEKKFSARYCKDPDLNFILRKNISNEKYFNKSLTITINPANACFDHSGKGLSNLTLVMLVHSHPDHFSRRKGIRSTWAKQQTIDQQRVRTLFVIGKTFKAGINREVEVEARHHKDIILANVVESFKNLTLKLVLGLKWVNEHCRYAKFMYKGDDDIFVNVVNIVRTLQIKDRIGKDTSRLYMGAINTGEVIRYPRSKYYVSEEAYSGKFYPPFCPGGGYVISTTLIPAMYARSLITQLIPIDDAYQGILAKLVGVVPVGHPGFKNWGGNYDTCTLQNNVLTLHGFANEYKFNDVWRKYNAHCNNYTNN